MGVKRLRLVNILSSVAQYL